MSQWYHWLESPTIPAISIYCSYSETVYWECAWARRRKRGKKRIRILKEWSWWLDIWVHDIYLPGFLSNNSWKRWHLHLNVRCTKIPVLQPSLPARDHVCVHWKSVDTSNPSSPLWFPKVLRNLLSPSGNYTHCLASQIDLWPQFKTCTRLGLQVLELNLSFSWINLTPRAIPCLYWDYRDLYSDGCWVCAFVSIFLNLSSQLRAIFTDFMIQFF